MENTPIKKLSNFEKKKSKIKFILPLILLVLIIGALFKINQLKDRVFVKNSTVFGSTNSVNNDFANSNPFNVLLLGYGGGNHDGAYLTDSIMVVHVDPKMKKIFLLSIPRDIWVKIPTSVNDGSYWKINTAYTIGMDDTDYPSKDSQFKGSDGAGHMAEYVVSQVTGLPIDYFVGMDFNGFKNTIDTLGGVDINVETAFTDTEYPIDGKENDLCGHPQSDLPMLEAEASTSAVETVFPCRYENLQFSAGPQHMDGERALSYVRSRHSLQDGTDFGRAKRQRNLLVAVKQKVFSIGFIPKIIPFIGSLGDDLRTDMTPSDINTLIGSSSLIDKYQITTLALTDQNFLVDTWSSDGQSILEPKDGLDNWTNVHNYINDTFSGKPQPVQAVVQVDNGTHVDGLAQIAANNLKNDGLSVLTPMSAQNQDFTTTQISYFDQNINQSDLGLLQKEFGVNPTYVASSSANFNTLVTVGNDYNSKVGKKLLNEP